MIVPIFAGVVFENLNETVADLPPHVVYKIRQNAALTPSTKIARHRFWFPGQGWSAIDYYYFGFVWIQVWHLTLSTPISMIIVHDIRTKRAFGSL